MIDPEHLLEKIEPFESRRQAILNIYKNFKSACKEVENLLLYCFSELFSETQITIEDLNYNKNLFNSMKTLADRYKILEFSNDESFQVKKWAKMPEFKFISSALITEIIDVLTQTYKKSPSEVSIYSPKFESMIYSLSVDPFFVALMLHTLKKMARMLKFKEYNRVLIISSDFIYFPLILVESLENEFKIVSFKTKNAALLKILIQKEIPIVVDTVELKNLKENNEKFDLAISFLPFQFISFMDINTFLSNLFNISHTFLFYQPTISSKTIDTCILSFFYDLSFLREDELISLIEKQNATIQQKDSIWLVKVHK